MNDPFRKNYRELEPSEIELMERIKSYISMLHEIYLRVGYDNQIAQAIFRLEESVMWAIKAVTK